MDKQITKKEVGRPTKYSDELVTKLESILKIGGTIEEACSYALISKETYYRWLEENSDFMTKMEQSQHYSDIAAKNVVIDTIVKDKDVNSAKWWLEKREFKTNNNQYNQVNVQGDMTLEFTRLPQIER